MVSSDGSGSTTVDGDQSAPGGGDGSFNGNSRGSFGGTSYPSWSSILTALAASNHTSKSEDPKPNSLMNKPRKQLKQELAR